MITLLDSCLATFTIILMVLGLYVSFGLLRVVNMCHGEVAMIGAYFGAYSLMSGTGFAFALAAGASVGAIMGVAISILVIRPGSTEFSTLLATWAISWILSEAVRLGFGASGIFVATPIQGIVMDIPIYQSLVAAFGLISFCLLFWFLKRTKPGLALRAINRNEKLSNDVGIPVTKYKRVAFVSVCAFTGASGVLLAPIIGVNPQMGAKLTIDSFLAVIAGGLYSFFSPIVGASIVGGFRSYADSLSGPTMAKLFTLVLALVIGCLHEKRFKIFSRRFFDRS